MADNRAGAPPRAQKDERLLRYILVEGVLKTGPLLASLSLLIDYLLESGFASHRLTPAQGEKLFLHGLLNGITSGAVFGLIAWWSRKREAKGGADGPDSEERHV
jgi:NhaP-type Na+/H+ or K+/H+ antiporter